MQSPYVLITPAYNEEVFLERCIDSVAAQTVLPLRWVIVSDGSTDRTDKIAREAASRLGFIRFLRLERPAKDRKSIDRVTKGIVAAVTSGVETVASLDFKYLGKMDADVTLEPAFFQTVLACMEADPQLGLAGGGIYNVGAPGGFLNPEFVGGPVRVFRRACWDAIGGLLPFGHEDVTSAAMARMKGWTVRCFPGIKAYQHGVPGNTVREKVPVCFHMGQMDHVMGGLLSFELARSLTRMLKPPFLAAGASMLAGYLWAWARRTPVELPTDLVNFVQAEQRRKMAGRFLKAWGWAPCFAGEQARGHNSSEHCHKQP